jgi:transcriptional regulator with PAS, ATPase and Fis domain
MKDLLDQKLERIEREFLLHELKEHGSNIDTLAKKFWLSREEIQRRFDIKVKSSL